jgi:hypothetical protein
MGYECRKFKKLFPAMKLLAGGVDSGFNKVLPTEYSGRLLHIQVRKV